MKTYRLFLIFLFLSAVFTGMSKAQVPELINNSEFRPDAKAAVDSIYNYNFEGAQSRLSHWKKEYPDHPLWLLMKGMQFWWKVLADLESMAHDDQLISLLKEVIYRAGKLLHDSPSHADGLIIKAVGNGYLARHHANRGNWIKSVNFGRKAISAYQYLQEVKPEFADLKLAKGLKLYYTDYLPEAYPIVKTVSWALPAGNREKGLRMLKEASDEAVFASAEATYFLGNINYNYENDYGVAVRHFEDLYSRYPDNNYYARILVKAYYKSRQFDKALSFIDKTLKYWERKSLPNSEVLKEELYTWRGKILEHQDKSEEAIESYVMAFQNSSKISNSDNRTYYAISGYFAGRLLFKEDQRERARKILSKVGGAKSDSGYEKRARKLLSKMD